MFDMKLFRKIQTLNATNKNMILKFNQFFFNYYNLQNFNLKRQKKLEIACHV